MKNKIWLVSLSFIFIIFSLNFVLACDKATTGLYNPTTSVYNLKNSNIDGTADIQITYGVPNGGWKPFAGDWDGDGIDTIGIYNINKSIFYLRNSSVPSDTSKISFDFGTPNSGWLPIAGDWDGDGKDTIGMYDPKNSIFYLKNSNDNTIADINITYGVPNGGWKPFAGDWDGDGIDTIGIYNINKSIFYLRNSNNPNNTNKTEIIFGSPGAGWLPIAGDWDGDGKDTVGIYNPIKLIFYLRNTNVPSDPSKVFFTFGTPNAGWLPIAGDWDNCDSSIKCTKNSDCGIDKANGNPFCQNNNVFQNYITYTCNNPGTVQSSCSSSVSSQIKQTCSSEQTCSDNNCIDNYAVLNGMYKTHINYFLNTNSVTKYGFPLTAYKVGQRARFGYSNPTEWGYLLQSYVSAAERGVISRNDALKKINVTLNTMAALQKDTNQNYKGLFYPYYKVTQTYSPGSDVFPYHDSNVNIPSIDNGLLYMSLLITEGWARDIGNTEITNKAKIIKDKMNFNIFLFNSGTNKYLAHTINKDTNALSVSKWDVYADEGGLMAFIAYASNSISLDDYKTLINSQMRSSVSWNGHTVKEGAWFNSMFTWGARNIAGYKVVGTSYSKDSFVPDVQAHQDFGNLKGVNYPGFSDAMTQGLVGYYVPPNLANTVPASAPSSITPHAFFIPFGVYEDLDKTSVNNLINYIQKLKVDSAGYYYGSGTYPYGFVVATSPYANQNNYNGIVPADGKNIFETLSESYTVLSLNDYLQRHDGKKDFFNYAVNVPGYQSKYNNSISFLYP